LVFKFITKRTERAKGGDALFPMSVGASWAAQDDRAVCAAGMSKLIAVANNLRPTIKGVNSFDTSVLQSEMYGRRNIAIDGLSALAVENITLAARGRTPNITCAEAIERAIVYIQGDLVGQSARDAERRAEEEKAAVAALNTGPDVRPAHWIDNPPLSPAGPSGPSVTPQLSLDEALALGRSVHGRHGRGSRLTGKSTRPPPAHYWAVQTRLSPVDFHTLDT